MVEPCKMIHMPVADERVADAQELARGQRAQVAEVEEQGPTLEHEVDVDAGIAERRVDEMRIEAARHGDPHVALSQSRYKLVRVRPQRVPQPDLRTHCGRV